MKDNAKKGYSAHAKFLRISPNKVKYIADHLRKKLYPEAMAVLENLPHRGAMYLKKVIQSAVSNVLYHNNKVDENMLYISELQVNEGPRMKRLWHRSRGRADRLLKRFCHISVVIDEIGNQGE
ncbi:MAG: 50S ribosomal protein L22 [Spirochaetales bacterium]|nr:50S ribosomal protein L22 [Spirochaetales bacterium]